MAIRLSGMNSGLDTESIVQAMVSSYSAKKDKYVKAQTRLSWTQDAWKNINTKVYGLYTSLDSLKFSSGYNTKKTTVSDTNKASVTATSDAAIGTQKLNILETAQTGYMTGGTLKSGSNGSTKLSDLYGDALGEGTFKIKYKNGTESDPITINGDTTVNDFVSKLKDAGIGANYDEKNNRIYINSKTVGSDGDFELVGTDDEGNANKALEALKVTEASAEAAGGKMVHGEDARIKLNGVYYTSSNGSFNINGMTINALNKTGDGDENAISINTTTDVQGLYDKVKDFLEQYNEVVNQVTKLYNAEAARGYQPLTDEQKEAMTDSQVEKWETKIKDSLLRRDTTLGGILNTMTGAMSAVYEVNDKKLSLGSFGISTLGILGSAKNEQNAYHIDGDADDSATSAKKDKLMQALTEDPDSVVDFMKQLATGLQGDLGKKMKSTSLRSAYTIYNDKEMASEYSDYTSTIKKWEEKVAKMEDKYYKQFTAMEKALANMNSSSSALGGLLGG